LEIEVDEWDWCWELVQKLLVFCELPSAL
jgi:hypothetical protein